MVHQLVYHSRYADTGGALSGFHAILGASRANNACDGITGFLIFDRTGFVQILEGHEDAVKAACDRIVRDPRHYGVTVVARRETTRRDFPGCAMEACVRGPEVNGIYLRHGIHDGMEARDLRAVQAIALARDLLAFEQSRRGERDTGVTRRA